MGASEEKAVPAPIVRPIVLYGICIVHQYIRKKIAITQIKQELFTIQKGVRTNVENKAWKSCKFMGLDSVESLNFM